MTTPTPQPAAAAANSRNLTFIIVVVAALAAVWFFTQSSSGSGGGGTAASIAGTRWDGEQSIVSELDASRDENLEVQFYFDVGGTLRIYFPEAENDYWVPGISGSYDPNALNDGGTEGQRITWTQDGDQVTVTDSNDPGHYDGSIRGDKLTLEWVPDYPDDDGATVSVVLTRHS